MSCPEPTESTEGAFHMQVSFISHGTIDIVTEATLRDIFCRYGDVQDVRIKKWKLTQVMLINV